MWETSTSCLALCPEKVTKVYFCCASELKDGYKKLHKSRIFPGVLNQQRTANLDMELSKRQYREAVTIVIYDSFVSNVYYYKSSTCHYNFPGKDLQPHSQLQEN